MCLQIFIHASRYFPWLGRRGRWPWPFRHHHQVHGHFMQPWPFIYYPWKLLLLSGWAWFQFSFMAKHHEILVKHFEPLLKHFEPLLKHHETLVKHYETLAIRCDDISTHIGSQRGDFSGRCRVSSDCGVGITPQMCNIVTNPWDMGIFSRPDRKD